MLCRQPMLPLLRSCKRRSSRNRRRVQDDMRRKSRTFDARHLSLQFFDVPLPWTMHLVSFLMRQRRCAHFAMSLYVSSLLPLHRSWTDSCFISDSFDQIGSEVYLLSHLKGRKHKEAICEHSSGMNPTREQLGVLNLKHIVDAPSDQIDPHIQMDKERQKALRKRCRKLRQRMAARFVPLTPSKYVSCHSG